MALVVAAATGCDGASPPAIPVAGDPERGREAYVTYCVACHSRDPAADGPLGPGIAGSSRELLEARVIRGTYPPGYVPKRETQLMVPVPQVAGRLADLEAYLASGTAAPAP